VARSMKSFTKAKSTLKQAERNFNTNVGVRFENGYVVSTSHIQCMYNTTFKNHNNSWFNTCYKTERYVFMHKKYIYDLILKCLFIFYFNTCVFSTRKNKYNDNIYPIEY